MIYIETLNVNGGVAIALIIILLVYYFFKK